MLPPLWGFLAAFSLCFNFAVNAAPLEGQISRDADAPFSHMIGQVLSHDPIDDQHILRVALEHQSLDAVERVLQYGILPDDRAIQNAIRNRPDALPLFCDFGARVRSNLTLVVAIASKNADVIRAVFDMASSIIERMGIKACTAKTPLECVLDHIARQKATSRLWHVMIIKSDNEEWFKAMMERYTRQPFNVVASFRWALGADDQLTARFMAIKYFDRLPLKYISVLFREAVDQGRLWFLSAFEGHDLSGLATAMLPWACENGSIPLLKWLIQQNGDIQFKDNFAPECAMEKGTFSTVNLLSRQS